MKDLLRFVFVLRVPNTFAPFTKLSPTAKILHRIFIHVPHVQHALHLTRTTHFMTFPNPLSEIV